MASFRHRRFLFVSALALGALLRCEPEGNQRGKIADEHRALFQFSRAREPMIYDEAQFQARSGNDVSSESADCAGCHATIYENWHSSRHRVAFTNPLYKESHEREPMAWCVNCHAPLMVANGDPLVEHDRVQASDGISCIVCHVRDNRIIAARTPVPVDGEGLAHDYKIVPDLSSAEFCAECHQFNFPTTASAVPHFSGEFEYASLPMQNTYNEWRESSFFGKMTCQNCHLRPYSDESHSFPGGHDFAELARAIQLRAERVDERNVQITVLTMGVGHSFPTGDLFRTLRVRISDHQGRLLREEIFKKHYDLVPMEERAPDVAPRILAADDVIPPPVGGDYSSGRNFLVTTESNDLQYALYMDYIDPVNHITTSLPLSVTRPLFAEGELPVVE